MVRGCQMMYGVIVFFSSQILLNPPNFGRGDAAKKAEKFSEVVNNSGMSLHAKLDPQENKRTNLPCTTPALWVTAE